MILHFLVMLDFIQTKWVHSKCSQNVSYLHHVNCQAPFLVQSWSILSHSNLFHFKVRQPGPGADAIFTVPLSPIHQPTFLGLLVTSNPILFYYRLCGCGPLTCKIINDILEWQVSNKRCSYYGKECSEHPNSWMTPCPPRLQFQTTWKECILTVKMTFSDIRAYTPQFLGAIQTNYTHHHFLDRSESCL